ncbi:hypothetical protein [Azospirillum sp. TSO22-1]|uniref:NACHT domain-containing protein n=1 Tax=Azospirillum sp. TSO22-1 TaxID=716789 RepID=UPI0011B727CD|nr:hypothetical protein [Azospirillum sp. TSO22-1]
MEDGREWNGYVVVQAKYLADSTTPAADATWLISQIDDEMAKYEDAKRALRRPEYYLLVTNAKLSASAADATGKGAGGIDKVEAQLKTWSAKLGIKGAHVWHADSLRIFLNNHSELRTYFSFWVQPGDVLSAHLKLLAQPTFDEVMPRAIRKQLRRGRDIKTKDAGQATGKSLHIEDVFVDLPLTDDVWFSNIDFENLDITFHEVSTADIVVEVSYNDLEDFSDDEYVDDSDFEQTQTSNVTALVFEHCADRLDPWQTADGSDDTLFKGRIVLLGGPGQGKSTIGQFIAQLCRARLLEQIDGPANTSEIRQIVSKVIKRASEEGVSIGGPARFPFQVELPSFADKLSDSVSAGKELSIIEHLSSQMSDAGEAPVSVSLLRQWLAATPTIIILDGLDEVPQSGNRTAVITAINDLVDTIQDIRADALLLVTSRPQGYDHELSPRFWSHWKMKELDTTSAMRFAERLAHVLISDDIRQMEVLDSLRSAAADPTTSPLMISPLQVGLLFALVETRNNIPKDKWTLFERHYEILRDREIAKGGSNGRLIGTYKADIDRIHFDAGYLLHVRAEEPANANAFLTPEEFAELVRSQLGRSGHEDVTGALEREIVWLATTRLVFLRCHVEKQIGFDVRSLQEFMAAARIMSSPEERIRARLKEVAGRTHWLHVFKIACSKIYSSASLLDFHGEILGILDALDAGDRDADDALVHSGAMLAMQILAEGIASSAPAQRRLLAARAMRLLDVNLPSTAQQLADVIDAGVTGAVEPQLLLALSGGGHPAVVAMKVLLHLSHSSDTLVRKWAISILDRALTFSNSEFLTAIDDPRLLPTAPTLSRHFIEAQWRAAPDALWRWSSLLRLRSKGDSHSILRDDENGYAICIVSTSDGRPTDLTLRFRSLNAMLHFDQPPVGAHPAWPFLRAAREFTNNPSQETLANAIAIAADPAVNDAVRNVPLPWPIANLIRGALPEDIIRRAVEVRVGKHGDVEAWQAAERRWVTQGITADELNNLNKDGIAADIAVFGAPPTGSIRKGRSGEAALPALLELRHLSDGSTSLDRFILACMVWGTTAAKHRDEVILFLESAVASKRIPSSEILSRILSLPPNFLDDTRISHLIRSLASNADHTVTARAASSRALITIFNLDPSARSLLPLLALSVGKAFGPNTQQLSRLDESAFNTTPSDTPSIRAATIALAMWTGQWDTSRIDDAVEAFTHSEARFSAVSFVEALAQKGEREFTSRLGAAIGRKLLSAQGARSPDVYRLIRKNVEVQRSGLSKAEVADHLKLPRRIGT